jgi:hypothetical protein
MQSLQKDGVFQEMSNRMRGVGQGHHSMHIGHAYSESGLLLSINLTGAGHAYRGGLFPRQGQASLTLPRALSQQVSSFKVREQVISVTAAGGTSPPLVGWGTLRRHAQPGQSTPSRAGSQT